MRSLWHSWHTSSIWHSWHTSSTWHWGLTHWLWLLLVSLLHTMWSWSSLIATHVLLMSSSHVVLSTLVWSSLLSVVIVSVSTIMLSVTTSLLSIMLHESGISSFIVLHDFDQLLEDLSHMWMSDEIIQVVSTSFLGHILFKVRFVHSFFSLKLSEFLDLIMIDD